MKRIIRGGTIVTDSTVFAGDILVEDGKIARVAERVESADAEVIDAAGRYVLPGAVDIHTHMDLDVGIAR